MNQKPQKPARLSMAQKDDLARAKRAARWVGLILPLALTVIGAVLLLVWMPRTPDPAATHWGGNGMPDGFGSPWVNFWGALGTSLAMVVMGAIMQFSSSRREVTVWGWANRFIPAVILGVVAMIQVMLVGLTYMQLDLDDAREMGSGLVPIIASMVLWVAATAVGFFVQPKVEVLPQAGEASDPLPLAKTARAVWVGEVRPSKTLVAILGGTILLTVLGTVLIWLTPAPLEDQIGKVIGISIMLATVLLLVVACLTSMWFKVRIDEGGLEARSILGWPVFRVAADDVARVEARQISPFSEYGGWGLRWVPGATGIVMRTGEGIVVTKADTRTLAITIDDADRAASALTTAAARAKGGNA